MTYTQAITKVRARCQKFNRTVTWMTDSMMFDIVNDAARQLLADVKDNVKTASLAIVSGTTAYTISTAIGADVGQIIQIEVPLTTGNPDGTIKPRTLWEYNEDKNATLFVDDDDTTDLVEGTPTFFKVLNNTTLTIYPEPDENITATVYYYPKVIYVAHSTANMATSPPIDDMYYDILVYKSLAIFFEIESDPKLAMYYHGMARQAAEEIKTNRPTYGPDKGIKFHDAFN
jgi:hypothetical protein